MGTHDHRRRARRAALVTTALVVAAIGAPAAATAALPESPLLVRESGAIATATTPQADQQRRFTVEVAENMHEFVFDTDRVFDDGLPAHGSAFVTHGYLYPGGFLKGRSGVRPDGAPRFPDAVIGEWWCRGYLIGDAAHATEGAWVYSTQLFSFGPDAEAGRRTLVVVGLEGAEVGTPVDGAVTGGTGRYARARGGARQTLLGFNATEGVAKRVTFHLR